ncbi:MAG: hypothetical protein GOVbin631_65 [Prokaryotic dsDNA virus sp.]|nr:MAG: hypothetical protein GOVbin631_65 [Prokaryotic dsDNA virus sp.]
MMNKSHTVIWCLISGGALSLLSGLFLMWFTYRYWSIAFEFAGVMAFCSAVALGAGLVMIWLVDGVNKWWNGDELHD